MQEHNDVEKKTIEIDDWDDQEGGLHPTAEEGTASGSVANESPETVSKKRLKKKKLPKKKKSEVSDLRERIAHLTEELEAREAELREAADKAIRAVADADNFKKRIAREGADATANAARNTIEKILPSLDNLDKALQAAEAENANLDALRDGVRMVYSQMMESLATQGLSKIEVTGKPYDPETSEALQMVESAAHEEGTVIEEFMPGYRFNNRVLRTAKVVVAKAPSADT